MSSLNDFYRRKRQIRTIAIVIAFVLLLTILYFAMGKSSGITIDDGYTTYYATSYVERDGCVEFVDNFGRSHKLCGIYHITNY